MKWKNERNVHAAAERDMNVIGVKAITGSAATTMSTITTIEDKGRVEIQFLTLIRPQMMTI
jgi:hypothetical protein